MAQKRVQVVITGRVQGVGYRASCQRQAAAVDAMVDWCREGPPMAYVSGVEISIPPDAPPERGFRVRG